jgi:DNA-directed RNA polymerase subunit RPC12/RpoP
MTARRLCPSCGGKDLYETVTAANGGHGPALLPKLGALFKLAKLHLVACADCGHVSFFIERETLERFPPAGTRWQRVR